MMPGGQKSFALVVMLHGMKVRIDVWNGKFAEIMGFENNLFTITDKKL